MTNIDITRANTRKITLPSFPKSVVEIKANGITVQETEKLVKVLDSDKGETLKQYELGIEGMVMGIVSWNLCAGDKELPINGESIKLLPVIDYKYLSQEIDGDLTNGEDGKLLSIEERAKIRKKK